LSFFLPSHRASVLLPFKLKEDLQRYQHDWYIRKKEGQETRLYVPLSKEERKKSKRRKDKRYKLKLKDKKKEIDKDFFGEGCYFCGNPEFLVRHRKDGKCHNPFSRMSFKKYKKEIATKKYVKLCSFCHRGCHWCMKFFKMDWKDIVRKQRRGLKRSKKNE